MQKKTPGILQRGLEKGLASNPHEAYVTSTEKTNDIEEAELYTSEVHTPDGTLVGHAPAIDIDGINVELIPSTTPGNYHLVIDKVTTWYNYEALLKALYNCKIIEYEFYQLSLRKGKTALRLPWVKKEMSEEDRRVRDVRAKLKADPDFPDSLLLDQGFSFDLREKVRAELALKNKK